MAFRITFGAPLGTRRGILRQVSTSARECNQLGTACARNHPRRQAQHSSMTRFWRMSSRNCCVLCAMPIAVCCVLCAMPIAAFQQDHKLVLAPDKFKLHMKGVPIDRAYDLVKQCIEADFSLQCLNPILVRHENPADDVLQADGLRVAGVPIGSPEFVTRYVESKRDAILRDLPKLDVLSDDLVHAHLMVFLSAPSLWFPWPQSPPGSCGCRCTRRSEPARRCASGDHSATIAPWHSRHRPQLGPCCTALLRARARASSSQRGAWSHPTAGVFQSRILLSCFAFRFLACSAGT